MSYTLLAVLEGAPEGFFLRPDILSKDLRRSIFALYCLNPQWFLERFGRLTDKVAGLVVFPNSSLAIGRMGSHLWRMGAPQHLWAELPVLIEHQLGLIDRLRQTQRANQGLAIDLARTHEDYIGMSGYFSLLQEQIRVFSGDRTSWTLNALTRLVRFAATDMEGIDVRLFPLMVVEFVMSEGLGYHGAAFFHRRPSDRHWNEAARKGHLYLSRLVETDRQTDLWQSGSELYVPFHVGDDAYLMVVAKQSPSAIFSAPEHTFFRLLTNVVASAFKIQKLSFFDNIQDMLYMHDLEGRFLTVNRAGFEKMGYHPDRVLGRSIQEFIHPEVPPEEFHRYLATTIANKSSQGVIRLVASDGTDHFMSYNNHLVCENDRSAYIRGSARDITERILEKRKLRQMEAWVHQAQKMETVGTLAGGVAHDFNNILTGIMGNLDLVLRKLPPDSPVERHIKTANDAAERAAEITRKLLTFGRKSKPMKVRIDLREMIDDVFRLLAETIDRRIAVRNQLPHDLWVIQADRSQMLQLVMNLCLNAQDALLEKRAMAPTKPHDDAMALRITVTGENITLRNNQLPKHSQGKPGEYVRLRIADTGCGMDKRTQERIFEPFFTTKQLNKGTGLGLSTVYGIVQQHEGWITVASQISQGTTFDIFLPADPRAGAKRLQEQTAPSPKNSNKKRETILVADDEEFIRNYCMEALGDAGYKVLSAPDGKAALDLFALHKEKVDLLILDLVMPHYSGKEVMERILSERPGTKIILSSGYSSEFIGGQEQISGQRAILPKPYSTEELMTTVRAALD